jgi:hypothetical protein
MERCHTRWLVSIGMVAVLLTGQAGAAFAPTDIADLQLWLRADAGVYEDAGTDPAEDGDPVVQWNDQSGQNNHATRNGSNGDMTFETGELGGQPTVSFMGGSGDDHLTVASYTPADTDDLTVFVVARADAQSSGGSAIRPLIFSGGPDNGTGAFAISTVRDQSASLGYFGRNYNSPYPYNDYTATTDSPNFSDGVGHVIVLRLSGAAGGGNGTFTGYYDGDTKEIHNGGTSTPGNGAVQIGGDPGSSSRRFAGDMAEILIYDRALTAGERNQVGWYLQQKYGLGGSHTNPSLYPPSLLAAWEFNADDVSGSDVAAGGGAAADTTGTLQDNASAAGGVLTLDGTGDYLQFGNNLAELRNLDAMTLCAWVKAGDSSTAMRRIVEHEDNIYFWQESGDFRYTTHGGGGQANSSTAPAGGMWQHVCAVLEQAGTTRIYVNGSLEDTVASGTMQNNTQTFQIGARRSGSGAPSNFFYGELDDVAVWDVALSLPQIEALAGKGRGGYAGRTVPTSTLVCHFDAASATHTDDAGTDFAQVGENIRRWEDLAELVAGNNHVQQNASGGDQPVVAMAGLPGSGDGLNGPHRVLRFDGNDNLLALDGGSGLAGCDPFGTALDTDQQTWFIVMKSADVAGLEAVYRAQTDLSSAHWGTFRSNADLTSHGRNGGALQGSSGSISAGQFIVVSARWDGDDDSVEQWVNGVSTGENTGESTSATLIFDRFRLGAQAGSGDPFTGDIAEMRIYSTALEDAERVAVQDALKARYLDPFTTDTVALYEFREWSPGGAAGVGAVVEDSTGVHDGTVQGAALDYVSGDPDYGDIAAIRFESDGAGDRVEIPDDPDFHFTGSFTLETLIKTTTTAVDGIVAKNGSSGTVSQWWMRMTGGQVQFLVRDENGHQFAAISDADELANSGAWTHLAAVYDAGTAELRLYIDYDLVQTATGLGAIDSAIGSNAQPIEIGEFYGSAARNFAGDIDFVRISNGALEPYQFRTHTVVGGTMFLIK